MAAAPSTPPPRTVLEHRAAVLALVAPLPTTEVDLDDALGLVLAVDVHAATAVPAWDNSAMDGYAVRAADVAAATPADPVRLPVLADLPAGSAATPQVDPGAAVRIMTGAPLPPGADAVVPVELTDAGTDVVAVRAGVGSGANVRRAGEDTEAGALVLTAGTVLRPTHLGAAAAAGAGRVVVHRRPVVAVLATGSELVAAGEPVRRGQIPDSNSRLLAAAVRAAGGDPVRLGTVPDDADALRALLAAQDGAVDLVVTSGGVSVGAYDVVKEVLTAWGAVEFVPVAMQPGRPQAAGRLPGGTPVIGLPGNPVSVHVSFEVFVRPALRRLRGCADVDPPGERAVVEDGWRSPAGRVQYMPVVVTAGDDGLRVRRAAPGGSGSHLVTGLARATGLAVVPAEVEAVYAGDVLMVTRSGWCD